jgi:hypothetical protein
MNYYVQMRRPAMGNRLGIYWVCSFALAIALLTAPASANTNMITYQGVLSDAGAPFTGAADMGFSLWNAASGGTQVWGVESVSGVQVSDGVFAVLLGATVPFGATFADNDQLWLEVQANMGSGMQTFAPRVPFTAAPFAFRAAEADSADVAESVEWTNVQNVPAGFADGTDDVNGGVASAVPWTGVTGIPAGFADNTDNVDGGAAASVPWAGVTGIPAGFADNTDNVDGGAAATVPWAGILGIPADLADGDDIDGGAAASVPWAGIAGMPAGFADGTDDVDGGTAANVAWTGITGMPAGFADNTDNIDGGNADLLDGLNSSAFAPTSHGHSASQITSGTLDIARIPVGTTAAQVASGAHLHSMGDLTDVAAPNPSSGDVISWTGAQWEATDSPAPNGVRKVTFSGYTTGNQQVDCRIQGLDSGSVVITAVFNHCGYIRDYGCSRMAMLGIPGCPWNPPQNVVDISNVTSGNGGQWEFYSEPNNVILIRKRAGTYGGGGYWFVTVEGSGLQGAL